MPSHGDTIFARASGAGRAGVAVYRLSGPSAFDFAEKLCEDLPAPKRVAVRSLRDRAGDIIDAGLVILFKGPRSFTGEDVAEFHLHGSAAVEASLYEALSALGARPAEAGEFTKRALLNGKLDLAEIEGLADLLDAETAEQRKQALGQLGGRLSAVAEGWRARLLAIMAPLEADIDFPDEEAVPAAVAARAGPAIDALTGELQAYRQSAAGARAIREGVKVAIVGAPNAGKSSLLNRLAGSERAIVSDEPGTTRDVIEARMDLGGILVSLFDTAGLRAGDVGAVEAEGMRRTRMNAENADIRLLMIDVSRETSAVGEAAQDLLRPGDFIVFNKIDIAAAPSSATPDGMAGFRLSAKTGAGVEALLEALTCAVREICRRSDVVPLTRARHVQSVETALRHLETARARIAGAPELAAEDVRLAARALGEITGAVGVEDVLGAIFASFCIGK